MRGARSKDRRPRAGGSWSVLSLTVLGIVGLVLVQFFLVAFRAEGVRSGSPHGASPHSMVVTPPLPGAGSSVGSGSQVPQTPNPAARPPPASLPAVRVRRQATGQDASHIGVVLPYKGSKNIGNPIKVDLRVYMNDAWDPERPARELKEGEREKPLGDWTGPATFLRTQRRLKAHPWTLIHSGNATVKVGSSALALSKDVPMEAAMAYMQGQPQCANRPIFMTMASVGHELYWQLVENFVYTMAKFGLSDCSIVVCMSDPNCMKKCDDWNFPCYDWTFEQQYPGVKRPPMMEQIAILKLRHLPKALEIGVDVFMLDLDVGFLASPTPLIDVFNDPINAKVDIFVQEDMIFIMNRTKIGWKTWYTEPLPNIGLFLVRGNKRTASIFHRAWSQYDKYATPHARTQPGKDQNHVLGAMREKRAQGKIKYAYFANNTALLLDKVYTWQHNRSVELGGAAAENILHGQKAVAIHTTCYESSVKLWALKAANAYWNPRYYDPMRPTISKMIQYGQQEQVQDEMRALVWLGAVTGRSVIMGNIVGGPQVYKHLKDDYDPKSVWPPAVIPPGVRASHFIRPGGFMAHYIHHAAPMWPGFRALKVDDSRLDLKALGMELLEHGFYWRVQRNYADVPPVTLVSFRAGTSLGAVKTLVEAAGSLITAPRMVLHACPRDLSQAVCEQQAQIVQRWAECSVGELIQSPTVAAWRAFKYAELPNLDSIADLAMKDRIVQRNVADGSRACKNIFGPLGGNRTCFGKCR